MRRTSSLRPNGPNVRRAAQCLLVVATMALMPSVHAAGERKSDEPPQPSLAARAADQEAVKAAIEATGGCYMPLNTYTDVNLALAACEARHDTRDEVLRRMRDPAVPPQQRSAPPPPPVQTAPAQRPRAHAKPNTHPR